MPGYGGAGCLAPAALDKLVFIVVSHTASIEGVGRLRGYAGRTGRLDVLMRSMVVASHIPGSSFIGVLERYEPPLSVLYRASCGSLASEREALTRLLRSSGGAGKCPALCRAGLEEAVY
jgi:hypothetical protein